MLSLPLEVRRAILREVDSKRDLCAVARVSRLMRIEAEWFIYRELDLGKRESARTVVAILKYILSSPVLPLYVRSFILTGVLQKETEYRLVAIFHLFSLVLQRMTRLRSLVIKLYPSPQINIFRRCTFKLSVLDVNYLDGPLVRFLESQPRIRILGLVAGLAKIMPIIPPAFLPILAAVITTDENAALLVPGRPVTHVRLPLNNRPSLEYLALSSAPILALSACIYCHKKDDEPLDTMIRLGRVAPDLEALYIVLLVKQNRDVVVRVYSLCLGAIEYTLTGPHEYRRQVQH
jgi:hypothetical protein